MSITKNKIVKLRAWFLILTLATLHCTAFSQDLIKKNEVFLELGGNGLFMSINFARQLTKSPGLELRGGLGVYGSETTYLTIPLSLNYNLRLGGSHSFLSMGVGGTYTKANVRLATLERIEGYENRNTPINFVPSLAYRYITSKDFVWKVGLFPVLISYGFLPSFGLSTGKRF
jgi:hypothetical protein